MTRRTVPAQHIDAGQAGQSKPDPSRVKRITESIIGLPTLPTVISKMIELVDSPRTSAASLARLISTDQALTAKMLKLANSAYYGFPREISTVNMAIVVLGFNTVKDMGLSLSVFDVFKNTENTEHFDVARFWEHSIACGVAARMLAKTYRSRFAGEAFVAGLLHDIGKVILNQYFHTEFIDIMNRCASGAMTLEEAEDAVIGTRHTRVGAWLAEKWNLPRIIVDTILYHHDSWEARVDPVFVSTVALGNIICHNSGMGHSGRPVQPLPDPRIWEVFSKAGVPIDEPDLPNLEMAFLLEFDKADTFLSFITEGEKQ